jgi:hypothetical protein
MKMKKTVVKSKLAKSPYKAGKGMKNKTMMTGKGGLGSLVKKLVNRKPATRKPATRKPATRKPATRKPATRGSKIAGEMSYARERDNVFSVRKPKQSNGLFKSPSKSYPSATGWAKTMLKGKTGMKRGK